MAASGAIALGLSEYRTDRRGAELALARSVAGDWSFFVLWL